MTERAVRKAYQVILIVLKICILLTGLEFTLKFIMSSLFFFNTQTELQFSQTAGLIVRVLLVLTTSVLWYLFYFNWHKFIYDKIQNTWQPGIWSKKLRAMSLMLLVLFTIDTIHFVRKLGYEKKDMFSTSILIGLEDPNETKFQFPKNSHKINSHLEVSLQSNKMRADLEPSEDHKQSSSFSLDDIIDQFWNYIIPRTKGFSTLLLSIFIFCLSSLIKKSKDLEDELKTVV